jgi:hypothetical protein
MKPKLKRLLARALAERQEALKGAESARPKLEAGLAALRSLLRACDYLFRRDEIPGTYDEPHLIMLERCGYHAEDRYAEQATDVDTVNRELCSRWIENFWLPAARDLLAWTSVADVEKDTPRGPVHEMTSLLFRAVLRNGPDVRPALLTSTARELAELRMALGRYGSGLEGYFAQLAVMVFESNPGYYEFSIEHAVERLVGVGHLDFEISNAEGPSDSSITHAKNFTWLKVRGTWYDFHSGNQALAVKALWKAYEEAGFRDGAGVSVADLGLAVDSSSTRFRMDLTFKDHPAMGTVIKRVRKGLYALCFDNSPASSLRQE